MQDSNKTIISNDTLTTLLTWQNALADSVQLDDGVREYAKRLLTIWLEVGNVDYDIRLAAITAILIADKSYNGRIDVTTLINYYIGKQDSPDYAPPQRINSKITDDIWMLEREMFIATCWHKTVKTFEIKSILSGDSARSCVVRVGGVVFMGDMYVVSDDIAYKKIGNDRNMLSSAFLRELRICQLVAHANVVPIIGVNTLGLFMPIATMSLYDYISDSNDSSNDGSNDNLHTKPDRIHLTGTNVQTNSVSTASHVQIADILQQLRCGIMYIHSCGCVHSDIKPANILLYLDFTTNTSLISSPITVKYCDFGSATTFDKYTGDDGSYFYTAPEVNTCKADKPQAYTCAAVNSKSKPVYTYINAGAIADIWSLGVVFAELYYKRLLHEHCDNDYVDIRNELAQKTYVVGESVDDHSMFRCLHASSVVKMLQEAQFRSL